MSQKIASSSVSQVSNFRACQRKWFFSSVDYLPQEPRRSTALGDVFHAVAERYLDVDENGLKNGKEPELYPDGWHIQKDFFGKKILFVLDDKEQAIIKNVMNKAIDQGVLIRRPGAVVEYKEKILITPDIKFEVRIDYGYEWTIEDHKTCKDFRHTLTEDENHPRYIGNDLQLKVYAYFWAKKRNKETGEKIPDYLTIRHNQFCVGAESPRIEVVKTRVTFAECEKCYLELEKDVLSQLTIRQKAAKGEIKWTDMEKNLDTCGSYGGCPYKSVCVCQESHQSYKKRMDRAITELTLKNNKEPQMSKFNLKKGATPAQQEVINELESKTAPEVSNVAPAPAPAKAELSTKDTLLQAKEQMETNCTAMGIDFNTVPKYKEITGALDLIEAAELKAKKAAEQKEQEAKAKAEADKLAKEKELEEASKKQEVVTEQAAEAVSEPEPVQDVKEETNESSPDRFKVQKPTKDRSKKIVVCINCAPIGSPLVDSITINQLFELKSAEMAHEQGVASYYDLDTFKRREAFHKAMPSIIKELAGFHVIAHSCGPDEQALLNAILGQDVICYANK